VFTIQRI